MYITKAKSFYHRISVLDPITVVSLATVLWTIPVNLSKWVNWNVWVHNEGGAGGDVLSQIWAEVSPDPLTTGTWVSLQSEKNPLDQTSDGLAVGGTAPVARIQNSCYHRARIRGRCGLMQSTTIFLWFEANQG